MQASDPELAAALATARPSSTGWWRANCPWCDERHGSPDRKRCLSVNVETGWYTCWRCRVKGRDPGLDADPEGAVPRVRRFEAQMVNEEWRQPYGTQLWQGPGATSAVHSALRGYLLARRVPTWVWPEADLRGDGDRVVIPIKGLHGEWCGSVARSLAGGYRYPRGMPRGQVMFNQSALYVETDEPVAIVEGVFDALPHWPHAVACLGKPSTDQYALLCGARRPLAIVLDRDASTEAWSLVQKLRLDGQRAWHVSTEPYDDPGDMPRVQFLARIGVTK